MRIIAGAFKGRKFYPPANKWPTRPTTDFAKEGLFNRLSNRLDFENIKVLDLFGGTGNHSYEIISRGCKDVTYVDKFGPCVDFVKATAKTLDIEDKITILRADVFKYLKQTNSTFDYIFAGPPYPLPKLPLIPDIIFENNRLNEGGLCIIEHNANNNFEKHPNFIESRNYGEAIFSYFQYE